MGELAHAKNAKFIKTEKLEHNLNQQIHKSL